MLSFIERICQQLETITQLLEKSVQQHDASLSREVDPDAETDLSHLSDLLDINQVIDLLKISEATYYRWVKQGELIPRRKGKRHYYCLSDLDKQLKEGRRRGRI
ncbi:helix-turn-helix domain-containing protein [Sphingobacterium anhuiense]|uniref:helix-turn-helix domain-containing protein n=1 Tax=Sphingobacterium anhuiense TaxID=493780 RepID=UPI003C2E1BCB